MPYINRIRVNNVKYNFGTQYYDDFVMRFSGKNTIYDLANGGGKSLLILLLFQNLIPNCTLDEKQPIEKLFRPNGGNTAIHSLIEWKLDPCYQKDNFTYMTTGFCARKGKSTQEDGEEISGAVRFLGMSNVNKDTASVEYFNYVIFYREFGDNDMRNLPLVNGNERVTYNGLKAYLRELEKRDFHVSVKIFEKKGEYQNFISAYGLFESEWEIIRGINKTEGHVRTYFETNYRTSRKVVEDLLIEEILQKSYNNRIGSNDDDGEMAKTLMDIKDKLIELAKKHGEIDSFHGQVKAMENFAGQIGEFEDIYLKKELLRNKLFDQLIACRIRNGHYEKQHEELERELNEIDEQIIREQCLIRTAQVLEEENSVRQIKESVTETAQKKEMLEKSLKEILKQLINKEAANDYRDYEMYLKSCEEIREAIDNRLRAHEDILRELKILSFVKHEKDRSASKELEEHIQTAAEQMKQSEMHFDELSDRERALDREIAVLNNRDSELQSDIEREEKIIRPLMESGLMLVAENAEEMIAKQQEILTELQDACERSQAEYENYYKKQETCKYNENRAEAALEVLAEQISQLEAQTEKAENLKQRFAAISKAYNETSYAELLSVIRATYENLSGEIAELKSRIEMTGKYTENLKKGRYVISGKQYETVKEYLAKHYGEDIIEGQIWYNSLNPGQKRDITKRAPFVRHGFVVKEDFERIKADTALRNFNNSSYMIPIISADVLYDTKLEVNTELIVFAGKDLEFLSDEAKVETEIRSVTEEIGTHKIKLEKLEGKAEFIREDYEFVLCYSAGPDKNQTDELGKLQAKYRKTSQERIILLESRHKLEERVRETRQLNKGYAEQVKECETEIVRLEKIKELNSFIQKKYAEANQIREKLKDTKTQFEEIRKQLTEAKFYRETKETSLLLIQGEKEKAEKEWKNLYAEFYPEEEFSEAEIKDYKNLEILSLESKFLGLKSVLAGETTDIHDKQALLNHYRSSMEKCRSSIEYKGLVFEEFGARYKEKQVYPSVPAELMQLKERSKSIEKELYGSVKELEAQSALMNRLEGSIEHGKKSIVERYGEYREFSCDNPQIFIGQHKMFIEKMNDTRKETAKRMKESDRRLKELSVTEKDLERIVGNAGFIIPDRAELFVDANQDPSAMELVEIDNYQDVQKEFELLLKREYRKKEEFQKQKMALVEKLNMLKAAELASEVMNRVEAPETAEKVKEIIENIQETNSYILLEKDRVAKGIRDMERIKDNFENRCVQICSNIRTQLDRLPKLSNIRMEDEEISIINIQIPYIKEELCKDRMSSYINETVTGSESFKNSEERLKYIRNRLSWKKLFSVIVTDMNAIRINLYKRERIKDQSRYLKYEEAVGSTGQSQGIYIQFLIAIINYIANINAASHENVSPGKVIFIDNPFGAAKDIYIWEPIFKLLKTNHVQMIVPARGVTPAITGRFDVNYVLGQKLSGNMQQTVVVDYYSQVQEEEMEYITMEFEQQSLFES